MVRQVEVRLQKSEGSDAGSVDAVLASRWPFGLDRLLTRESGCGVEIPGGRNGVDGRVHGLWVDMIRILVDREYANLSMC